MTKAFIDYIIQLTSMTTLLCVALFLGLQWKTVKNIDKANLSKRAKQFSFKKLRYISIDEIAIKKRHKYMTIFTDISTGQIIHAVEGRKEEYLRPFLKLLSKKSKRLRGIGIDMSAAYSSSIKKHLPHISIIFDRFHVTKLLNNTSGSKIMPGFQPSIFGWRIPRTTFARKLPLFFLGSLNARPPVLSSKKIVYLFAVLSINIFPIQIQYCSKYPLH